MYGLTVVAILTTCLGGCGLLGSTPVANRSLDQMVVPTSQHAALDQSTSSDRSAMATLPPAAGSIQKISRQNFSDGAQQQIGYDHSVPGLKSNELRVAVMTPVSTTRLEQPAGRPTPRDKPTEADIKAILVSDFPRMPMRIVDSPRSNDYGVYGLAAGQWANGVRCIYAWQWIDPLKSADDGTVVSLRVRLCRSDMTLDQLAETVDHLRIDPARRGIDVQAALAEPTLPPQTRKPVVAAEKAIAKPAARRLATHPAAPLLALQASIPASEASEPSPSLPAAAYRGPLPNARTASQ